MTKKAQSAPRCAALVGPYQSGKTTLLEGILFATGATNRKGSVNEGNTVGDSSQEARARQMSTEATVSTTEYLGDTWTFIDCPGSVELTQEVYNALMVVDSAVVVCEADPNKVLTLAPLLRFIADRSIPHIIFINKADSAEAKIRATFEALHELSELPLVLREIPIREGEGISGFVDLASERAFQWQPHKPSELVQMPSAVEEDEKAARAQMLEALADFNDTLLEELLEDVTPSTDEIYENLTKDQQESLIVPVFFGTGLGNHGISRLLKALRHETAEPQQTAERLGVEATEPVVAHCFKSLYAAHTGKISFVRVWHGEITDGMTLNDERVSGVSRPLGSKLDKQAKAGVGEVVALGRMDGIKTGDILTPGGGGRVANWPEPLAPLYALSIHAEQRADEVKLSGALSKLAEEDPSFTFEQNQDTNELVIWGQGEMHLQIVIDRLRNHYNLGVVSQKPQVPYKETIRKPVSQHARHKKQSGGHGQFGDVHLDIKPLPRGSGFVFNDSITGGVVPKQYIPAVEAGVRDYMNRGPLGFQVIDVSVTLTDGQYHTVDSSDMAFKTAGAMAMREGMPNAGPVLLEPICHVEIAVPTEFTSRIQRLVSGRRGQILGFDAKDGWKGWDEVKVQLPQAEMFDLINELRSITSGVGTFNWGFDHLQEFTGREADQVIAQRAESD